MIIKLKLQPAANRRVSVATRRQSTQQQQQQHVQKRTHKHSNSSHTRSHEHTIRTHTYAIRSIFAHSITTFYLWWLFGTCLIFSTNGGRGTVGIVGTNSGSATTHYAAAGDGDDTETARTSGNSWNHIGKAKISMLVTAAYLETDELINELDRPGE